MTKHFTSQLCSTIRMAITMLLGLPNLCNESSVVAKKVKVDGQLVAFILHPL